MQDPVLPLSNNAFADRNLPSSRVCSLRGKFICIPPCFLMYCFGRRISFNAASASSSESAFISSIVSSVASTCLLGFTQILRIPILCSGFSSAIRCVIHLAVPGKTRSPLYLLWKLCLVSKFDVCSFFWPRGRCVWLFSLLVGQSPRNLEPSHN
jgi:hypothetical protein